MRIPSVPLITCDPYFSLWSPADRLYDTDTIHWSSQTKPLRGVVTIDGKQYRFLGSGEQPPLEQTGFVLSPTRSSYTFEGAGIRLSACFWTPLLLSDLELVSRPCSYLDLTVEPLDGGNHRVRVELTADERFCYDQSEHRRMIGQEFSHGPYRAAWMRQARQAPLCHSGDGVSIDWGTMYLAAPNLAGYQAGMSVNQADSHTRLWAAREFEPVDRTCTAFFVFGYDDTLSIQYFSRALSGYWARNGCTIYEALAQAVEEHDGLYRRCEAFDRYLTGWACELAGEEYALICSAAYRQAIAAHKLVEDEDGQVIFLSKECYSNGCIGTVDISYPSMPLFLLFNPELVKGMMRPVCRFARLPAWDFPFAPHDVGRYPYVTGQVYGLLGYTDRPDDGQPFEGVRMGKRDVYPPFYQFPSGEGLYNLRYQMPVEECGNMLILAAAVLLRDGDLSFARENLDLMRQWACYLMEYGADPGDQLCTDDFAGHLAHNINLAGKAVMGIASYSILLERLGHSWEAECYLSRAREMAAELERRASAGDHTRLTFDREDSWSLKYNLIWDQLFHTGLFSEAFYQREIAWYKANTGRYGVPLDSRDAYTKSDWLVWAASLSSDREDLRTLIRPLSRFLQESPDRVPFADHYHTGTARYFVSQERGFGFQNRTVVGGVFMPLLKAKDCLGRING